MRALVGLIFAFLSCGALRAEAQVTSYPLRSDGQGAQKPAGVSLGKWTLLLSGGWMKPSDFSGLYGFQVGLGRDLGRRFRFQGSLGVAVGSDDASFEWTQADWPARQFVRTTIRRWSLTGDIRRDVFQAGGLRFRVGAGLSFHHFVQDVEVAGNIGGAVSYTGSADRSETVVSPYGLVAVEKEWGRRFVSWISVIYDVIKPLGGFVFPIELFPLAGDSVPGRGRYPSLTMRGLAVYGGVGLRL